MQSVATFTTILSLPFSGISGTYAPVGGPSTKRVKGICFTNDTEGSVVFSLDGVNDHVFTKAGSFKLWDLQANMNTQKDDSFVLPVGTQWYVKQLAAPVSGAVYIESIV